MMTPRDFVDRWAHSHLREQQAAQSHFNELCQLVGHKTPTQLDPEDTFFTFEEQVAKATGGKGRADVWYKGHFAWEYKGKHKDLDAAYHQLLAYKGDLDNPPLLVVCDFLEYRLYPQWPNTSGLPFVFRNEDLLRPDYQRFILWLLESPEKFLELRQSELEQREQLTLQLAEKFAHLADLMRQHTGADGQPLWQPMQIARFLTKLVFALFTEDIGLLPVIGDVLPALRYIFVGARKTPEGFVRTLRSLFEAMNGEQMFLMEYIPYFNGGLFAESRPGAGDGFEVLDVTHIPGATDLLNEVSEADWRFVNPTIFGTLFEGALDISKRAQLGAHYTGEADIRLVVEPVLMQPLYRQWDAMQTAVQPLMQVYLDPTSTICPQTEAKEKLTALHNQMMNALEQTRVLDPACGSGNFLYMSLRALKDLEGRVRRVFEPLELPYRDVVTPRQLYGIEKDEFAANLAKVVVWIGYLQWRYEDEGGVLHYFKPRKMEHPRQLPTPILKDKNSPDEPDRIVCDDAIMRYRVLQPHPPAPSPFTERGSEETRSDSPSPPVERGLGGEVFYEQERRWLTPSELWEMLKPLARQMRHEPTPAEEKLWEALRNRQLDSLKFRRQHTIDRFIADFYCAEAHLIVEVDGDIHQYTQEEDALRTAFLESQGLRVIRVRNEDVLHNLDTVLTQLRAALTSPTASDSPSLYTERGLGGEVLQPYEPDWPEVDVIMGNPPFLGGNRIRGELGNYVDDLFNLYDERVPAFADLVCYWHEKARAHIEQGKAKRAGLLATNSIRGGVNREVLKRIKETGDIFMAWSDREWVLAGAAVRISIVGFDGGKESTRTLNGGFVTTVNPDLTSLADITQSKHLEENENLSYQGPSPKGSFDISSSVAEEMLNSINPNGKSNADVVKPVVNAADIVRRNRQYWTIDFGNDISLDEAAQYIKPFEYVKQHVYPERLTNNRKAYRDKWWLYAEARHGMRDALRPITRYIVTPRVAKHRVFVWLDKNTFCNDAMIAIARDDDYFFGVLHSYLHEIWSLRLGTSLEDRPRYTPTTTFETFPFPWPPGKEDTASPHHAAVSAAAQQLHDERDHWLNPPPEEHISLGITEKTLKERTLTNLYNALVEFRSSGTPHQPEPHPPAPSPFTERGSKAKNGNGNGNGRIAKAAREFAPRLAQLHDALDRAVLAAYGWDDLMAGEGHVSAVSLRSTDGDEELLRRLLALNLERAGVATSA